MVLGERSGAGAPLLVPGNLALALEAAAQAGGWASDVAFVVGDRAFTHAEVHQGAARAATVLSGLGAGPGDRVLLAVSDGIEFVWAFLGAVRIGALAIPVNPRLTAEDHRFMLDDARPRVVVTDDVLDDRFASAATVCMASTLEAALNGAAAHPGADVAAGDPAYAQYTSGTTGMPKAAVHRHSDPAVYHRAFAGPAAGIGRDDVLLSVSKMFFAYGLGNSLFFPLFAGCRAVLDPGPPKPEPIAELVRRHQVTVVFSVPTFYARLVTDGSRGDLPSLRAAVCAGEPLKPALAERVRAALRCPILDGLGSTEVGQTFVSNTVAEQRNGTVGRTLPPYEVAVRDDDRNDLPLGRPGTLWVRGPTVLLEYLGRPDATAAVLDGDWLCTGDRAMIEPDGFVRHHGRVDDIEIVGGINIGPYEVEEVLARHPAVAEVAVAAVRDPLGASRLVAFVVVTPGTGQPDHVAAEVAELARSTLAPHKVPKEVRFVDSFPRTPTGKLRRFVLRSGAWGRSVSS